MFRNVRGLLTLSHPGRTAGKPGDRSAQGRSACLIVDVRRSRAHTATEGPAVYSSQGPRQRSGLIAATVFPSPGRPASPQPYSACFRLGQICPLCRMIAP
jgi:hypothetical protein